MNNSTDCHTRIGGYPSERRSARVIILRWILACAKMTKAVLALVLMVVLFSFPSSAQTVTTPRTETTLLTDTTSVTPGKTFWAVLHIKLKDGWHTYWKNPGDSGTIPSISWTLPSGFTAGEIEYLPPERLPAGPLMDYGYNHDAYYLVHITAPALVNENAQMIFMAKAQWLVCMDVCVPEKAELSLALPVTPAGAEPRVSADAPLIDDLVKTLPQPLGDAVDFSVADGQVRFTVKLPKALDGTPQSVAFFPATDGIIANNAEQKVNAGGNTAIFAVKQGDAAIMTSEGEGLISIVQAGGEHLNYAFKLQKAGAAVAPVSSPTPPVSTAPVPMKNPVQAGVSIGLSIALALIGGLILNLMPCVLPILSLKVLSVAKKAKSEPAKVRKQALAYTAGVILSFMLMAALLLTLQHFTGETLGWGFQMQSPVFVALLALLMLLVGLNLSGGFELPVLMGNVGGNAAAEDNAMGSFLTGVLAVLVATPCSAPFMAPAIGFALTQSVSVVLMVFAALGFGLAAPFFLFSLVPGLASLLPRPGAWMLVLRQFLAFPIYLTVVWLLWVLGGEAGMNGAGVAMLGMVAACFSIFLLQRRSSLLRLLGFAVAVATVYGLMHGIVPLAHVREEGAHVFTTIKLANLRASGKPVFVDATADWCITCKVNESVALSKPEVKAAFEKQGITLLVADWTRGDAMITEYLASFGRSGVPMYVYYPAGGGAPKLLPQILTPAIVLEAVKE